MMFIMLTNIIEETTELLCVGNNAKSLVMEAFDLSADTDEIILKALYPAKNS